MILRDKKKLWLLAAPLLLLFILKLWERTRRPPLLPGLGGAPTSIAFSPDGKTVVCASSNGMVQKWMPEIKKWRSFIQSAGYARSQRLLISRLRFSQDGQTLYGGGSVFSSSPAYAWDLATRRPRFSFNSVTGPIFDVTPDGHWAAIGYEDSVNIVNLNGKPAPPRTDGFKESPDFRWLPSRKIQLTGYATCVAFSPDSKTLAVGNQRSQAPLSFWNVATTQQMPTSAWNIPAASQPAGSSFTSTSAEPLFAEWSPDGKRIAVIGAGKITIYDTSTHGVVETAWPSPQFSSSWRMGGNPEDIASLAWSPDGQFLFSGGDEVRQWNAKDLTLVRSYKTAGPVAVSPDGKTLATANRPDMNEPPGVRLVPL